jgi:hypothetical protein
MAEAHSNKRRPIIPGERIGMLVTIKPFTDPDTGYKYWFCQCDCGKRKLIHVCVLRASAIGCGCRRGENHGRTSTTEYRIWCGMIQRCTNPNHDAYHRYGGRGVKICERWRQSFSAFLQDMGPRPTPKYSLDRYPKNDGDYEPGNCRWATSKEQGRNTRVNHVVTFNGQTRCLAEWANITGIGEVTLRYRIAKFKWPIEKALTTPARAKAPKQFFTFNGQTLCLEDWATLTGFSAATLWNRIVTSEWSIEDALTTPSRGKRSKLCS